MADWNIYKHDDYHREDALKTHSLVVEPIGVDNWQAVYRREHGRHPQGHRYPNSCIGLSERPITLEDLDRVGDQLDRRDVLPDVLLSKGVPGPEA